MKKIYYIGGIAILSGILIVSKNLLFENPTDDISKPNIVENLDIYKIDEDKIITSRSTYSLLYEPTNQNLYDNSYIVLIATFDKDLKTYSDNGIIRTDSSFNTVKVIKNTSDKDVSKSVTIKRNGGVMNLKTYLESPGAHDVLKEQNLNIKAKAADQYYLNDATPYTLKKDKQYLLFIDIYKNELYPSAIYHGIKEIQNNKAYNYLSNSYEKTSLIDE